MIVCYTREKSVLLLSLINTNKTIVYLIYHFWKQKYYELFTLEYPKKLLFRRKIWYRFRFHVIVLNIDFTVFSYKICNVKRLNSVILIVCKSIFDKDKKQGFYMSLYIDVFLKPQIYELNWKRTCNL